MQLAGSNADPMSSIAPWVPPAAKLASDKETPEKANSNEDDDDDGENLGPVKLSDEDVATLKPWLNPEYLLSAVLTQLRKRFADPEQGSAVQLDEFLQPKVAQALRDATRAADVWEKANKSASASSSLSSSSAAAQEHEDSNKEASLFAPYSAGLGDGWQACGPVHKQRFLRFVDTSSSADDAPAAATTASQGDSSSKQAAGLLLEEVRTKVFGSAAFQRWLFEVLTHMCSAVTRT